MASVVFFRAVNVGGHQRFQPSQLAKALAEFDVVNIGAAGTFVVRVKMSVARLRGELLGHLPFRPEMMICPARDVLALKAAEPFRGAPDSKAVTRYVTVLKHPLKPLPKFPLPFPEAGKWEIQFLALHQDCLVSVRRPGPKDLYPNAVAEKLFGIPATTRNWNTIESICRVLES